MFQRNPGFGKRHRHPGLMNSSWRLRHNSSARAVVARQVLECEGDLCDFSISSETASDAPSLFLEICRLQACTDCNLALSLSLSRAHADPVLIHPFSCFTKTQLPRYLPLRENRIQPTDFKSTTQSSRFLGVTCLEAPTPPSLMPPPLSHPRLLTIPRVPHLPPKLMDASALTDSAQNRSPRVHLTHSSQSSDRGCRGSRSELRFISHTGRSPFHVREILRLRVPNTL